MPSIRGHGLTRARSAIRRHLQKACSAERRSRRNGFGGERPKDGRPGAQTAERASRDVSWGGGNGAGVGGPSGEGALGKEFLPASLGTIVLTLK